MDTRNKVSSTAQTNISTMDGYLAEVRLQKKKWNNSTLIHDDRLMIFQPLLKLSTETLTL